MKGKTNISDEVKRAVENEEKRLQADKKYRELETFYQEMKSIGAIKSSSYSLPPLDTIGKRLHESSVIYRSKI